MKQIIEKELSKKPYSPSFWGTAINQQKTL